MEKINDLFDKRVDLVCDNYSSIFTKDDVISMLSGLRAEMLIEATKLQPDSSQYDVDAINRAVADIIDNIDFDEYITCEPELCGSYGQSFSLEMNTSFDAYQFARQIECELTDYFNDLNKETNES